MKKIMGVLVGLLFLAPALAWGQTWVPPAVDKEGKYVEGHWKTPEDTRQENYTTPGKINPYTGQYNPYTSGIKGSSPTPPNPSSVPLNPADPNDTRNLRRKYMYPGSN